MTNSIDSAVMATRNRADTPLDGGMGYDFGPGEIAPRPNLEVAIAQAKKEALGRITVSPGSKVIFIVNNPYGGDEALVTAVEKPRLSRFSLEMMP